MKNIFLIPTDKPSRLIHNDANQLCYQSNKSFKNDRKWMYRKAFNIYITSDEEIKEGYYLNTEYGNVIKCNKHTESVFAVIEDKTHLKKIILTTDQDLIADGVKQISEEYLLKIIKELNNV